MSGTLYLVATPIGNLGDLTHRAVEVLKQADVIACEDTRHSRTLLDHYGILRPAQGAAPKLVSYYRQNEAARTQELLARLRAGEAVALLSDAGTPLVADPGARLVEAAVAAGIAVVPVPGPSAALAALTASGLWGPGEAAALLGFPPHRAGERRRWLERWQAWPALLVLFESPHRIEATVADLETVFGPARALALARELTKLHEEFIRGTVAEVRTRLAQQPPRGEYTLVIAAPPPPPRPPSPNALKRERYRTIAKGGR
ncbi:MAG: 16S rRNA (cytidine(1402)-2'-O)-methyltransferase [Terriglobales bacterium]